jgi:hypothetical protein
MVARFTLLGRFTPRAGLVHLRQTSVRRSHPSAFVLASSNGKRALGVDPLKGPIPPPALGKSRLHQQSVTCPLPPGADKVDSAEGMATLEGMSSHYNFRPGQRNKLVSEPPIAAPDEHVQLVEADQRFRTALGQAIAAGDERIEAVKATVQLKRRTKLSR